MLVLRGKSAITNKEGCSQERKQPTYELYNNENNSLYTRKASTILMGIVMTQVIIIRPTVPHFTSLNRMTLPVPMIDDVITWVVDNGCPIKVDVWIMIEELRSEAKPLTGSIFIIFLLTVLIIRQPPIEVPRPIAAAAEILTQIGTSSVV